MEKKLLRQLIMLSKWTLRGAIVQTFFVGMLYANRGEAQSPKSINDVRIDLKVRNANLQDVFKMIEAKTDYDFVYDEKTLDHDLKLSLSEKKASLYNILMEISRQSDLQFRQINSVINVDKKTSSNPEVTGVPSQSQSVTGKVVDNDNDEGLPGVNVIIKGTTEGTVTDVEGKYHISVPAGQAVLVFSSVGYISEEVAVGSRSVIDVKLVPDVKSLEEIVVIGYGSRAKKDVTTSISSIESNEISKSVAMSPEMAMQGTMTGVQVSNNNGNPMNRPTIRIRGVNTWGVASPLYVVDGIPITELGSGIEGQEDARVADIQGPLNIMTMIDPNDIESISVLKDASAAAIYGVRAANGVVLITTKKGTGDKPTVEFSSRFGVQNITKKLDYLNTQQYCRPYQQCLCF